MEAGLGHLEFCRVVGRVGFVLSALGSLWKVLSRCLNDSLCC